MPIVTLREILQDANKNRYAIGMFDVHNLEMTGAAIAAAEQEHSPIIIALAEAHADTVQKLEDISNIAVYAAKRAKVPVAVHFDHGMTLENIIRVMHLGFSSVMYDGSTLPYAQNIKNTTEVVRFAKVFGASVEGELGHVGGGEGGTDDGHGVVYTEPEQAADFIANTGVDALAVSIGTAHGVYKEKPKLDISRLRAIKAKTKTPLVLHGGSGLTDLDFRNCITAGICKVNIYTEIVQAAMSRINCEVNSPYAEACGRCEKPKQAPKTSAELVELVTGLVTSVLQADGKTMQYPDLMGLSIEGMKQVIVTKLRLFGSAGKA